VKAAVIDRFGGPDELKVVEVPDPTPGPRDLLVQVHATSVNPIDFKVRKGYQKGAVWRRPPQMILGMDVSGTVVAVGPKVNRFAVGDAVIASPTHTRPGTYAELVAIDERSCARKPESIGHTEAATLPLVGLTAWGCLVGGAKLKEGERVLIQAGSGGVGSFAVQLAHHLGAEVAATCSGRNVELVTSLGADRVVDYTKERFDEVLPSPDVVLECMGGEIARRSYRHLRRGGRFASINAGLDERASRMNPYRAMVQTIFANAGFIIGARIARGVKVSMVVRKSDGDALQQIADLVDAGAIKPVVDQVFGLDGIANAHRYCETGRARGKVAIEVRQ